jgi:hypothetical protein
MARNGSLFGVTNGGESGCGPYASGCGTVFELAPPRTAGAKWTHTVIFRFSEAQSGGGPNGLIVGENGHSLIGTAQIRSGFDPNACPQTQGCGLVFGLTPPPSGTGYWSEGLLHVFDYDPPSMDGAYPEPGLFQDASGKVFGLTGGGGGNGRGTLFQLTPVASGPPWPETQVYSFVAPGFASTFGVIPGPSGTFFGVTSEEGDGPCNAINADFHGCGTVFELTP